MASTIAFPHVGADEIPAVPTGTALTGADPLARARQLVAATSDGLDDVDAGWVAVYRELEIPVIDATGQSTIADDPFGPRWEEVWALGGLSRGTATVRLSDLGTTLTLDAAAPSDPAVLLADLRAAAVSPDPAVQTFGAFVAGKAAANGGADPLDPATTPDQVSMDAATIELVVWAAMRDAFESSIAGDPLPAPPSGFAPAAAPRRVAQETPCSESLGTADQTSWINWVAGKVGGGVGIDGVVSTPGLVEKLVSQLKTASQGVDAAKAAGAKAAKLVNRLNVITSILSLAAQVNAVQVNPSMEPSPLIRQRKAVDGDQATVHLGLSFSAEALKSNAQALCGLSIVANALGIGLSFPTDGAPLANVEVIVTSGRNFGTKVYFGANADRKRTTNDAGQVDIEVQGKARKKAVPDSAPERQDEFGLNFETQVEEVTGQSLLNVFIDGLSLGAGGISGALDVAKSYHFDLGEYVFPFTDYETAYQVSVSSHWEFPESMLALSADFSDAVLEADEDGTFTGSALVKWTTGVIGGSGCSLVETGPNVSSAVLSGTIDGNGVLTVTVDYDEAVVVNTLNCPPVSHETNVTLVPGRVTIVGPAGEDMQGTVDQLLTGPGSRLGTAVYHVVPN